MARIIQVILPLVGVVLAEAQLHLPFFDIPGLPHPARPISDGPRDNWAAHKNEGYDGGFNTWFPHFGNPDTHQFSSDSHERDKSYEDFDPFYHRDPHYHNEDWGQMPEIHNVFNIPNPSYNHHRHLPPHKVNNPDEEPKQDHNDGFNDHKPEDNHKNDEKPKEQENGPKLNEANIPDVKNKSDILPPKTNEIKKEDDKNGKDNKQDVGVDKKKDFLLVGQGGNNVYLLHENNPNPNPVITSNPNQPGNNIMYVPYNPGQSNNPVYQVINAQPTNMQMSQDKIGVSNGYNNAASNPGQSTMNMNAGTQNPGYVTIYSNGQLIQIPGVVVNSAPNNVPSNQVQGTNYIIANTVPNNMQTVPAIQNPGTNVIYATLPNQASNSPIYVQMPNCMHTISNGCSSGTVAQNPVQGVNNGMSNNGLPSNVVVYQPNSNTISQPAVYSNGVSNGYVQPNMVTSAGQGTIAVANTNQNNPVYNNQNGQYQPAVELPVNSGSNGYNQPIVANPGQGQNAPNQGGMINNVNMPIQTAVQLPVSSNGYNQPLVTSHKQEVNTPNQGGMTNNQNMPFQPAVEMSVNSGIPGYNQPMASNQGQGLNAPNQGGMANNQNMPLQPAVEIPITNGYNDHPMVTNPSPSVNVENRGEMPNIQNDPLQPAVSANSDSNGYNQPPQVSSQGDQGTNAIVNTPSNAVVLSPPDNTQSLATSLVLDSNNLSSLGAQPAIMISGFKDTGDKKDKKKSKVKKEKKAKGKKKDKKLKEEKDEKPKEEEDEKPKEEKDKKPKDALEPEVPEPFTNKKI